MKYSAKDITVLEGLEAVRKRPGMYVGDIHKAILQMIFEAVDNAVDEFVAGYATKLKLIIEKTKITVVDNGRGIPVDMHETNKPAVEVVMTVLHSGGKFGGSSYQYSGGLHGVGISVVNALSKKLDVEVYKDNQIYAISFYKGNLDKELHIIGPTLEKGTLISFEPDFDILPEQWPTKEEISDRLQEISFLNSGLEIIFEDNGITKSFKSNLQQVLTDKENFAHCIIYIKDKQVECAFGWTTRDSESVLCYTNGIRQTDGGTHLIGFKTAINRAIQAYIEKQKKKINCTPEDVRNGIRAILAIKLQEPSFASQTKTRLVTAEARNIVERSIFEFLTNWLEENPKEAQKILEVIALSTRKREAALKARELTKKSERSEFSLQGKLAPCTGKPEESELFLVEGDSAGGTAKTERDIKTQAIFPLGGKILNVARVPVNRALKFEELVSLITALGTNIGEKFDYSKLRYHKIIIMADADVDGQHIFCLLAMFFAKFMPKLFEENIYVARPPLFKITVGNKFSYVRNEEELEDYMLTRISNLNVSSNGVRLDKTQIKNLLQKCKNLSHFIDTNSFTAEKEIIALALAYNLEDLEKWGAMALGGNINIISQDNQLKINLKNTYGESDSVIDLTDKFRISELPITIENNNSKKLIMCPLRLIEVLQTESSKSIYVQRYKGLGEMNPDELYETCLDKNTRVIEKLHIPVESTKEVWENMIEIMGDENERRPFVLEELSKLFNLKINY